MSPSTREVATSSCMRFNERKKVDLPQPLGPMMAVTARASMSMETFFRTWCLPKYTDRFFTDNAGTGRDAAVAGMAFLLSGFGIVAPGFSAFPLGTVFISSGGVMVEFMYFSGSG